MEVTKNLPDTIDRRLFVFYDPRLDMFANAEDMDQFLIVLKGIVQEFVEPFPFASFALNWPPVELILPSSSAQSPLKTLYVSLEALLSGCGFPVTAILNTTVEYHGPKEKTVVKTVSKCRLGNVH